MFFVHLCVLIIAPSWLVVSNVEFIEKKYQKGRNLKLKNLRIQENTWSKFCGLLECQKAVGVLCDMALVGHQRKTCTLMQILKL